jgi:flagellar biosynthesis protein FlhG
MRNYNDQAAGIRNMKKVKPVRVIAIASGKGGVGKTNFSVNLGVSMSKLGRQVALLDADMGLANVDILLGIRPEFNLSHVLTGEKTMHEIMLEGPAGLKVIPASSGIQKMSDLSNIEQGAIINAFSEMDENLDVLIVDTAAGISPSVVNFARASQDVIVVVCDEPTSLTDAYAFIKLLNRDYGVNHFHVLSNMVRTIKQGQVLFNKLTKVTDSYLDVSLQYAGAIPYDENLRKSVQKQTAVIEAYPGCEASKAINDIARRIDNWPINNKSDGYLEFFVERMIEYSAQEDAA